MENKIITNKLIELNVDAFIAFSNQTRLWFTDFSSSSGFLIITKNNAQLYVDSRYFETAKKNAKNVEVIRFIPTEKKEFNFKSVLVESNYLTLDELTKITKWFNNPTIQKINSQEFRIIKNDHAIQCVKHAAQIALKSLMDIKKYIIDGISEIELSNHLRWHIVNNGGEKESFDTIVVSGKRGSLPHGKPTSKIMKNGELVTIDFGAIYKGYASDISRTFHIGKVTNHKLIDIENVVKDAQKLGIKNVKPGITTFEIDKICREFINKKGYGKYFVHSTGHGLGIDVHELPNITSNKKNITTLKPGMIITIEPGIYIPKVGGVRIEDDILVTKTGFEILSKIDTK